MRNPTRPPISRPTQRPFVHFLTNGVPRSAYIGALFGVLAFISWLGYLSNGQFMGVLDQQAQAIAKKTVEQTAAAFVIAKSINGAVSVAATFTVGAGALVNGSIEPGKVLDPFDRLIDDFSDYLLIAATAATLTQLLLVIDSSVGFGVVVPFCFLLGIIVYLLRHHRRGWRFHIGALCQTTLAFVVLLRFGLPLVLIASHQGYETFLAPSYTQAQSKLNDIQEKTKAMYTSITETKDHSDQWLFSRWANNASDQVDGVRAAASVLRDNFDHFFDAIFTMTAVMALEIVFFPIGIGWVMWRLTRRITGALWYQNPPAYAG